MKKIFFACVACLLILNFCFVCFAQPNIQIDGKPNEWKDIPIFIPRETEDINISIPLVAYTDGEKKIIGTCYQFDVSGIKMTADSNNLFILIELADTLENYFQKNREGKCKVVGIGKFYFDIDNDQNTGGKEFFTKLSGFEKRLTISMGFREKIALPYENFIGYRLLRYDTQKEKFDFMKGITKDTIRDPDYIATTNNFIEIKIPQREIGISKGQIIRVFFSETGGKGSFKEKFSEEIIKMVK